MHFFKTDILSIITAFISTLAVFRVAHSAIAQIKPDVSNSEPSASTYVANADTLIMAPSVIAHTIPNQDISKTLSERQYGVEYLSTNDLDFIFLQPVSGSADPSDATCGTDAVNTCIWNGIYAVFVFFFDGYLENYTKRDTNIVVTDYPPLPDCSIRCRLSTEAGEGDYRLIGNITNIVNDTFHTIHYMRNGTMSGLRSIYEGHITTDSFGDNSLEIRQAENSEGGIVVDYYWDSGNLEAYDSFDSYTELIENAASDVESCFLNYNSILCCASFGDDQYVDTGFVTMGWNYLGYEISADGITEQLARCEFYAENQ